MNKVGKGDKILFGAFGRNSIIHSFIYWVEWESLIYVEE
jgi:hypothetical protein